MITASSCGVNFINLPRLGEKANANTCTLVALHYYTRCTYLQCMPHAHLNDFWTNTCRLLLAGMARAFGMVNHARAMKCEKWRRRAKRLYYTERVWGCERGFEPHRMQGYGRFSRWPLALFALLETGVLSHTHCCQHGLHGVVTAFMLSVFSSVFMPGSWLFLPHSHQQFLPFWRHDNETTSAATPLRW